MDVIARRLLFRIGTVRLCIDLSELVEILEQVADLIDFRQIDDHLSVVGAMSFRRTSIPVIDLAKRLGISSDSPDIVLILNSQEGNWGLFADEVYGFFLASEMEDLLVPELLKAPGWRCFEQVSLHAGSSFLRLDLASCYAGVGI